MRLTLRAAGLVAIAVGVVTCTDAPTGPAAGRGASAHLGVAPTFSPAAARAYGALASLGIVVTQVHIALTADDGRLALDTTIQFPADQDLLTITLPVEITGAEQTFTAVIELSDASGLKLFAQTQLVTARAATLPGEAPPVITLEYVGPGRNARTVTVAPTDVSVAPTAPQSLTATAADASGNPVPDLLVSWTSSDPTLATVVGTGTTASVTALGRRGTVTISATTPTGITGSAHVNLLSLPTHLALSSGDLQVDSVGLALARPFAVRVTDDAGLPVQGASVAWTRTAGTGAPTAATSISDVSGLATLAYTLGTTLGADTVRASLPGVATSAGAVLFTARSISRAASAIAVVSGDAQAAAVLGRLASPLVVRVSDSFGNPVAGASVSWSAAVAGSATFAPASGLTDATGNAQTLATLGATAGPVSVVATTGTARATFAAEALAGALGSLVKDANMVADDQYVIPGARFPTLPRVRALDAASNPVAGVTVTFSANLGSVSASAVTDAAGYAQAASWVAGATEGAMTVTASAGAAPPVSWRSFSVAPSVVELVSQTTTTVQNGALGTPVSFTVQVMDSSKVTRHPLAAAGIVVNAIPNDFNLVPGSVLTATTDAAGRATIGPIRVNAPVGTISFELRSPSLPVAAVSQPTAVVSGPATTIESPYPGMAAEPLAAGTSSQLFFRVTDGYNVPRTPATVTLSIAGGGCTLRSSPTMTSDANGEVHPLVGLPSDVGGCIMRASLPAASTAESQLAIYAPGTTHAWRGGVSDTWDDPANWFPVPPTSAGTVPSGASQVLVPSWPAAYATPRLTSTAPIDKLWLQTGGSIDLSGQTLVVRSGVVAPGASLTNGTTQMIGSGPMAGSFDRVMIGQLDGVCGGVNASLLLVTAKTVDVYCATRVDSIARVQSLRVYATGGTLALPNVASSLVVSGDADFSGDLLQVDNGYLEVDGTATLGGGRVAVSGGQLTLRGAAIFKSAAASFDVANVLVQSDATVAGTGRQLFNSGTLTLGGNFTQLDPGVANFDASADHATIFSGAKPQVISFADPNSSHFGRLEIDNPLGVTFATGSNQPISVPTARSMILRPNGALIVGSNAAVSLSGGISLLTGSRLTVEGSLSVLSCSNVGATIDGKGLINDLLATLFVCQ